MLLIAVLASVCLTACNGPGILQDGYHPTLERELDELRTSGHLTYRVGPGDTLWSISRRFGTTVSALIETNGIKITSDLNIGQVLKIPLVRVSKPVYRSRKSMVWPVRGEVVVRFGQRKDGLRSWGMDIRTRRNEAIVACADGVVRKAGRFVGLGQTVVIKHTDGTVTFYGRNGAVSVSVGRPVRAGEEIARAPSLSEDMPVVHFRMYKKGKPVDPQKYLP